MCDDLLYGREIYVCLCEGVKKVLVLQRTLASRLNNNDVRCMNSLQAIKLR